MKNVLFLLISTCVLQLSPSQVSAQCSAPCVPLEGTFVSDFDHRLSRALLLNQRETKFWQRVSLGVSTTDLFQVPFANNEAAPWPSTDLWQPRTSIRAELAMYQDSSPSGIKLSLGYVRGARVPPWLPKQRGTAGIILKMPFTLLD